jgi:hypothetical protein
VTLILVNDSANHAEQNSQSRNPDEKGRLFGTELTAPRNVLFDSLALLFFCRLPRANQEQDSKRKRAQ